MPPARTAPRKGRGAVSNLPGRFDRTAAEAADDGWGSLEEPLPPLATELHPDAARSVISYNRSPDIPFDRSINPYRGCEHGCIYCYARPSHAYLNLSPGLDFETKIFYKADAAARLAEELRAPGYRCAPIALGANTDPYQPAEKTLRVTRSLLEVLLAYRHPVALITKSTLVLRDQDLLGALAQQNLVHVAVSLTSLDPAIKRSLEPRAAGPLARLQVIRQLAQHGIPVSVMTAPVIPAINDHELENLLAAATQAGARGAGYVLLRLPHEVNPLFQEWLRTWFPDRAAHVMSLINQCRGGRDYDSAYGRRMRGTGPYAELLARRFAVACRRLGLNSKARGALATHLFRVPPRAGDQLGLF